LRDPRALPMTGDVKVRSEEGFGLIELLMAMVMLNVGILALVAAFQSGSTALKRSSRIATAATLADSQLELYRALTYSQIVLDPAQLASVDSTYTCDVALGAACPNSTSAELTGTCSLQPNACKPSRIVAGTYGDGYRYRVDTYIVSETPPSGRALKKVTVVVRDGNNLTRAWARQTSTFDPTVSG
jgi:Tfp pilus assembly protein PilE